MNTQSILHQLHALLHRSALTDADALLSSAIAQAEQEGDLSSLKLLLNEQIGFFRDCGRFPEALACAAKTRALFEDAGETHTVSYATTLQNCANAYRAAGAYDQAAAAFAQVEQLYSALLPREDERVAGLWNNLALLQQETGAWADACRSLEQALSIAEALEDVTKIAISCANLAVCLLHLGQTQNALVQLERADKILQGKSPSDFHYSAVLAGFGDCYQKLGQPEQAASYYEAALAEIQLHMGRNNFYDIVSENLAQAYAALGSDRPILSGLELSRRFFHTFGEPMLQTSFPQLWPQLAIGLAGEGSECLGFDDGLSRDHDFGPGFCIWVPDTMDAADVARLQAAYDALPKCYYGITRNTQPQGKDRVGVCRIGDFFHRLLGLRRAPTTQEEWLTAKESALAAANSGAVFVDNLGEFSAQRKQLAQGYPKAVFLRKLAQALGNMAQQGQYNYPRMRRRGELAAAQLCLYKFCISAMTAVHLLAGVFAPYEKWLCKSTRRLTVIPGIGDQIETLLLTPPRMGQLEDVAHDPICEQVSTICARIVESAAQKTGAAIPEDGYLMDTAEELAQQAAELESQESLADQLAELEYHAFDTVQDVSGRANCQNDWETFRIMRHSQYVHWPAALLAAWRDYFAGELRSGRNLITEKYARMMEHTDPAAYAALADQLPGLSDEFIQLREGIIPIQVAWMEQFAKAYPALAVRARRIHSSEDTPYDTSFETYLRGELSVYPMEILYGYGRWIVELHQDGQNLQEMTMLDTVKAYGYRDLEEAEEMG